ARVFTRHAQLRIEQEADQILAAFLAAFVDEVEQNALNQHHVLVSLLRRYGGALYAVNVGMAETKCFVAFQSDRGGDGIDRDAGAEIDVEVGTLASVQPLDQPFDDTVDSHLSPP